MAFRFDAIRLDASKISKTGSGAMRVPALVARSGVFSYTDSSGKTVREYRPPEEVLKADSIATLKDLPVTNRHPKGFVDPSTWKGVAIGHVSSESPRADATQGGVFADLVISDANAQAKIGTDLIEVSCGYRVDLDETPGIAPNGEAYDRVQRNIQQNHVALGPKQWGRQGSAVSMRLDSAGDEIAPTDSPVDSIDTAKGIFPMKIKIDGVEFDAANEGELQAKIDAHRAAVAKTDSSAEVERLKAQVDVQAKQLVAEKARADAAPEVARVAIEARSALEVAASAVLGKSAKFDGKSDKDIRVEVITHFDSTFKADGKSEDYIVATFATWSKAAPVASRADAGTRRLALGLNGAAGDGHGRADSAEKIDEYDIDAARARRDARNADAFKKPMPGCLTKAQADASPVY